MQDRVQVGFTELPKGPMYGKRIILTAVALDISSVSRFNLGS